MGQRGKVAAAALTVIPAGPLPRLEPPHELDAAQQAIWRRIVQTKPPEWFTVDGAPLLTAYCRAITDAEVIEGLVRAFDIAATDTPEGLRRYAQLLSMRRESAGVLWKLATSMRLTPQSRYQAKPAATAADRTATGTKPWQRRSA